MELGIQEEGWVVTQLILQFFVVVEEVKPLVSLEESVFILALVEGMTVWKEKGKNNWGVVEDWEVETWDQHLGQQMESLEFTIPNEMMLLE